MLCARKLFAVNKVFRIIPPCTGRLPFEHQDDHLNEAIPSRIDRAVTAYLSMRLAAMVARCLDGLPNRYLAPCARFR